MAAPASVPMPVSVLITPPTVVVAVAAVGPVAPPTVPVPFTGVERGRQLSHLPVLPLAVLEQGLEQGVVTHAGPGRRLEAGVTGGWPE